MRPPLRTVRHPVPDRGRSPEPCPIVGAGSGVHASRASGPAAGLLQLRLQVAGLADVNSDAVAHSGWSMKGLRLPWKL